MRQTFLVAAVGLLLAASADAGQPGAAALLREGNRLFNQGRYEEAYRFFDRGRQLESDPVFVRSMGYCMLKLMKHEEAWNLFSEYLESRPGASDRARVQALVSRLLVILGTKVEIWSSPGGAEVTFDNQASSQGRTPGSFTIPPGDHLAALCAPGFQSTTVRFVALERQTVRLRVTLRRASEHTIAPASRPTGLLTMRSIPSGAEVRLDGAAIGRTPLERLEVPTGRARLTITHPDHAPLAAAIRIAPAQELRAEARLQRSRAVMYAGLGTMLVGVVLATTFGVLAIGEQSSCEDQGGRLVARDHGSCNLRTLSILSDVGTGLAVAGGVTALVGYLWSRPSLRLQTR